jgi:hypothetical protein
MDLDNGGDITDHHDEQDVAQEEHEELPKPRQLPDDLPKSLWDAPKRDTQSQEHEFWDDWKGAFRADP